MSAVSSKGSAQVFLSQDQHMVHAFEANTAQEPLADCVAVGRRRRRSDDGRSTAGGHRIEYAAELVVVVSNQESRAIIERHRFTKLFCSPLVRRVPRHVEMHDRAVLETNDKEGEDRPEGEVVELEEIAGPDVLTMILDEAAPRLAATTAGPEGPYVFLDGSFADAKPKLEELSPDPFAAPGTVLRCHAANERNKLGSFARTPLLLRPRA